jgi:hypothetical protein
MKHLLLSCLLMLAPAARTAEFRNLDFESANTNSLYWLVYDPIFDATLGFGSVEDLVPGWELFTSILGNPGRKENDIHLNNWTVENFAVNDNSSPLRHPHDGTYSFTAGPGGQGVAGLRKDYMTQIGVVPGDAFSLRFLAFGDPWDVYLNDVEITLIGYDTPLVPGEFREILGDISAFAGQEVELKFVTRSVSFGYNGLDSIRFSPEAVPEPGALPLLLAGGALGWAVRRRRRAAQR